MSEGMHLMSNMFGSTLVVWLAPVKTDNASSQSMIMGSASIRIAVSRAITSDSELEWDTAPCFLQIQVSGTKVRGPARTM